MRGIIVCERSGKVREAFNRRGFDVWSCDLQPSDIPGKHIIGDALEWINDGWDFMIAHPPCTYLSNVSVKWIHLENDRMEKVRQAREFFMALWNSDIPYKGLENPVPHKYAELPPYSQIVHPRYFGGYGDKRTCLWLSGLPPLMATCTYPPGKRYKAPNGRQGSEWYYRTARYKDRRSITFDTVAEAMAEQWGNYLHDRNVR